MKHAALAIIASISFHIAIATLVAVALAERDGLDVESARLDLSKMDFSLSYEETDAQPESADSLPPVSARETPPPPESAAVQPAEPPPPESAQAQPENPKLPEPEEVPCTVEMTSPPTPATKQASIDAPPRPQSNIRPEYPAGARARGEQGVVTLEIDVSADGTTSGVTTVASSGFAALDDAAAKAVRRARFVPARSDGRAVPGRVRLTLAFRLKSR